MCLAIPGKIESITDKGPLDRTGQVNFGGILKEANLAFAPEAEVGDYVIVHVGFAIKQLDEKEVVFFGVDFETTAPATAIAVYQAANRQLANFSLLLSHVLVPPAIQAILSSPNCTVHGFLAAGHVCTVMGFTEYEPLTVADHRFDEPSECLSGLVLQGIRKPRDCPAFAARFHDGLIGGSPPEVPRRRHWFHGRLRDR